MQERNESSGFTLIELLVVIGIITLLAASLLVAVVETKDHMDQQVDKIALQRRYLLFQIAQQKGKPLPPNGGHEFDYYPWVSGTEERSPENLERHFVAGSMSARLRELLDKGDLRGELTDYAKITSADTDYAGRAAEHYHHRMFRGAYEPLLATDNEHGNTYADGSVLVLYGNGAVRTVHREKVPEAAGDPGYVIDVGPGSDVPALRKLRR